MKRPKTVSYNSAVKELFSVARTLSSTLDLDALLKQVGDVAEKFTGAEASCVLLLDEDGKHLHFKVATGRKSGVLKRQTVPTTEGLAGWVARHWKPLIVNDVAQDVRFRRDIDIATGFKTRSVLAVPMMMGGRLIGVCEAINKNVKSGFTKRDLVLLSDLANFSAVSVANAKLAETQQNFFKNMIEILVAAVEARDPRYVGHPARVCEMACAMARRLGVDGLAYKDLYYASLLHDVGMLAVNHKNLTELAAGAQDRSVERLHSELGERLLKDVKIFKGVAPLIRHHHEFWDGSGHPDGLAGESIPLGSRILCLLEQLEELRFSGIKEPELSTMQIQLAKNGAENKFDSRVVDAFVDVKASRRPAFEKSL